LTGLTWGRRARRRDDPRTISPMNRNERDIAERALRRLSVLGVFTTAMAYRAGLTPAVARRRIANERWIPVAGRGLIDRGDLAGEEPDSARRRAVAGGLTWPTAIVCHRTAGLLHDFPIADDGETHLAVEGRRASYRGLTPHVHPVDADDVVRRYATGVTSRRRTALDCLALLPPREAERLLAWLRTREAVTLDDLTQEIEARRGRPGVRQWRHLVALTEGGALSELERRLHQLLRQAGLTGWEANVPVVVGGRILANVDVLFPAHRVIIEADGEEAHRDHERDRARRNALLLAGYAVLQFTWSQVNEQPDLVITQILQALRQAQPA